MAAFGIFVFWAVIWLVVAAAKNNTSYKRLASRGIPARGILLAVAATPGASVGAGLNKLQSRQVTIDIEVAGQPPYVLVTTILIPLNLVRDVVPGATVELRLQARDRGTIMVVGPGVAFNTSTLMTQGQIDQGAA